MSKPQQRLGRGLDSLLGGVKITPNANIATEPPKQQVVGQKIAIDKIEVNPFQPRKNFDEEALLELSESIKQYGVIQPITLREIGEDKYQIISGERRFRASKLAGLTEVPAYVRETDDDKMLAVALIENIQREDLDAIEIAISYQRLIDELGITHEELSSYVNKQRSTITNFLRLLKLPPEIQIGITNHDISMGHARALAGIDDNDLKLKLYTRIIEEDLSVRQVEEIIRESKESNGELKEKKSKPKNSLPEEYIVLQNQLKDKLKADAKIKRKDDGKGEIVIPFSSNVDFERLIGIFDSINSEN